MADITVRKVRLQFDDPIDLDRSDEEIAAILPSMGLSLTMPYLEPYLIRTMKVALKKIRDPVLTEDVKRFSQQEGHHYRNHAVFNDQLRGRFDDATADRLRGIEHDLEADYQRFTRKKSLAFNVTYAEGFEAMTCAGALAFAEHGSSLPAMPGGEIWPWHMVEEIEHRTVAFDVFEHLVGGYARRVLGGGWAQWHYLGYVRRFTRCMADGLGRKLIRPRSPAHSKALRNYLRTLRPSYDPARIELPAGVAEMLAHYSAMVDRGAA